jgi:hypothetical protein
MSAKQSTSAETVVAPASAPDPATHGLFGFQPMPATGRQRHLFADDGSAASDSLPCTESRRLSTVSPTWPRPWSKSTPADKIIARRFKVEDTRADLF